MSKNVKEIILRTVDEEGIVKVGRLQALTGLSRQGLHHHLKVLLERGAIRREGAGRGTHYLPVGLGAAPLLAREPEGPTPSRTLRFDLVGLEEHEVWRRAQETGALDDLGREALDLLAYALTEMVNNAIDHSAGDALELTVEREGDRLQLTIADDGVGAFAHLRDELSLEDELEALQEVSKGKVTTDPERHSGEGLFFTSRAVDLFELRAGRLRWVVDNLREEQAVGEGERLRGTTVRLELRPGVPRDLQALFAAHTRDFAFVRTRAVVKLFEYGTRFVSRSEGKRLVRGLERFREIVVDFRGVELVGQGFADELFRVWARAHPECRLEPVNMNDAIALFVGRARRA